MNSPRCPRFVARFVVTGLVCGLLSGLLVPSTADATLVSFGKLSNNAPENIASQLSADVTLSSGKVLVKFINAGPLASFIGQIYIDDSNARLSNLTTLDDTNPATSVGVSFSSGASPSNLPSGNTAVPAFTTDLSASADNPAPQNGVHPGQMVGILFDGNLADVLGDIQTGALRFGLHVQGIGQTGNSDAYVSLPEPTSLSLTLLSVGTLLLRRRSGK
jgi:hypothetical protein